MAHTVKGLFLHTRTFGIYMPRTTTIRPLIEQVCDVRVCRAYADRQTDRQTDSQPAIWPASQTDTEREREAETDTDRRRHRQTQTCTGRHRQTQTDTGMEDTARIRKTQENTGRTGQDRPGLTERHGDRQTDTYVRTYIHTHTMY